MTEDGRLSIGEFARRSGLSISALRFYGDCGLLAPARIDAWTGYRTYAAAQLRDATLVRELRALEMPIAEIRAVLTADPAAARAALDEHWRRLERRLDRGRRALAAAQQLLSSREDLMPATAHIPASDLARAFRQVLPAAGECGQERSYPAAVLVEVRGDGLRLVATDGHRLAVRDLAAPTSGTGRVVIGAGDAAKLADALDRPGDAAVTGAETLGIRVGEDLFEAVAASTHYPDYEAVLARAGEGRLIVRADELARHLDPGRECVVLALGRAGTTADERPFDAEYRGEELTIGFNPAFLADALAAGIGPDAVLQLGGPVDPVAIRSADDGTLTHLVMPIRLLEPHEGRLA